MQINIRELTYEDEADFLKMTNQSQALHHIWVKPPLNHEEFNEFYIRVSQTSNKSYITFTQDNDIVGVFNISEIVRGCFQSAYLGFYASSLFAGKGLMSKSLKQLIHKAFVELQLHRIEANIQPENKKSIDLVKNNGFRKEGFSPRYLKINNQWCDHERWAMTVEEWMG
jgi:ribosomal-protein-alanine N-acetyltransferase